MVGLQEPIPLDVELDVSTPAIVGEEAVVSYYVVQPYEDYRYHVLTTAVVAPEPNSGLLLATALTGLVATMGAVAAWSRREKVR